MLLKRLELLGFKSFANRAVFEFEPGISALVGPNGSGKSNVADAVRWVLGEQSAKALRGRKAEEVIFVGSAGRHPLGMAEVALVFDNSARRLPLDYAEVRIARRLYRSGESEYLVNGARVRRKDLVGLLLEVGLHAEGYAIIGQGAVEELVMQRPEERRAVLEHAADISRHQARLAEARGRLTATEQNLVRCRDLVAELEPHARRLRGQAEKAERFAARRAELAAVARAYYRAALAEKEREAAAAEEALRSATAEADALEADIAAREARRGTDRDELALLDGELARLRAELEALHRERSAGLADLAAGRQRVGFLEARVETSTAEVESAARRVADLAERLERERRALGDDQQAASGRALERQSAEVDQLEAQLRQTRRALDAARSGQARVAQEREQLERAAEQARERRLREQQAAAEAAAQRQRLEERQAELERQARRHDEELRAGRQRQAEQAGQREAARRAREEARQMVAAAREREQARRAELAVARAALEALRDEVASGGQTGGSGLAATLVVPAEYEAAIAAALGEWARAVVLPSVDDARAALSREVKGRALVLSPSAESTGASFGERLPGLLGGLWHQSAADLLRSAGPLGPLAFTVVVRDLPDAEQAAARLAAAGEPVWQVATLAGQVLTSFGGGARGAESAADRMVSLRRREAEAGARAEELAAWVGEAVEARQAAETALAAAEAREREVQAAEAAWTAEQRVLLRQRDEAVAERRRLDEALRRLPAVRAESQAGEPEAALEARRAALAAQAVEWAAQEAAAAEALPALQERWERAWAQREATRRQAEQEAAERRARRQALAGRERSLAEARQAGERAARQAEAASAELAELRARLDGLEARGSAVVEAIAEASRQIDDLARRRAAGQADLDQVEAVVADLRRRLAEARPRREAALVARQQAADDLARLRAEAEATADELGLGGEGMVQLRLLSEPASPGEAPMVELDVDPATARRRLQALQRELRSYGAISESVLEEYREVDERLRFLSGQSADLRAAMDEMEAVIAELEGLMREGFSVAFERVNAIFEKTFATLFGGGTARLMLTDPSDTLRTGVDIVAQPPGKRLQNLMSLSGGERALTSTALIFALLAINPLPFCVLDEVDAALDESNARRFAALLQEYSERTQFVIITHNRATMETARTLYGISMGGDGVTTVLSLRPAEALAHARNGRQADHGSQSVLQT